MLEKTVFIPNCMLYTIYRAIDAQEQESNVPGPDVRFQPRNRHGSGHNDWPDYRLPAGQMARNIALVHPDFSGVRHHFGISEYFHTGETGDEG